MKPKSRIRNLKIIDSEGLKKEKGKKTKVSKKVKGKEGFRYKRSKK